MTDNDLRAILLKKFYDKRREGGFQWDKADFDDIEETLDSQDIFRICDQLNDHGLVQWKTLKAAGGVSVGGHGKISAQGVDVIEGTAKSPISINLDRSITVHGSSHVQIGNNNTQGIEIHIREILEQIEKSPGTPEQKAEAKSKLKDFLEVAKVIIPAATSLLPTLLG
jgi:CRISPR/Cas system CMR-associated protein Cmr3 (group 5 of RAMP superfamily)